MAEKRPTIVEVAMKAGVSKSTASCALRGSPLVKMATMERIQKIARRIGYRPNMVFSVMASGNRRGRKNANLLSLAYLYDTGGGDKSAGIPDFKHLPRAASDYGYSIDTYDINLFSSPYELRSLLFHRGYCGVVIGRITNERSVIYQLDLGGFTVVSSTNTFWDYKYHRVSGDMFRTVQLAWDKAVAAGYRRIAAAICRHSPPVPDDDLRLAAVLQGQYRNSRTTVRIPPFLGSPSDGVGFTSWFRKWRPDAVIGFHVGMYYVLKDTLRARIPEETGFSGLIIDPEDPWHDRISGVYYQEDEVAEIAISIMDQQVRKRIQGMPQHVMKVLIEPRWIEGTTMPGPRSK